jgi:WD40 repeat protein
MAFAVGSGTDEASLSLWLVRAYNSETGVVAWSDQFNTGIEGGATVATIKGDKVFVGGLSFSQNSEGTFVVRAYDYRTGTLLWDDEYNNEGLGSLGVNAISVKEGRVYAVGTVSGSGGDELFVIRVYDSSTGYLIWEDQSTGGALVDAPLSVYAGTNMVYAAGFIFPDSGPVVFLVRAYDSGTGALVWEDEYDQGAVHDSCTSAYAVSGQGNRVYVAGKIATGEDSEDCASDFLVRAYDSATGELAWQDQFFDGGEENFFSTIVAKESRIYAAGMVETDEDIKKFAVRTYQATAGDQVQFHESARTRGAITEAQAQVRARALRLFKQRKQLSSGAVDAMHKYRTPELMTKKTKTYEKTWIIR